MNWAGGKKVTPLLSSPLLWWLVPLCKKTASPFLALFLQHNTGLQIIFFSWKDICPAKTPSWSDKTNCGRTSPKKGWKLYILKITILTVKWFTIKKIVRTSCPTTVGISSDTSRFWSANVRWPTVICSPPSITSPAIISNSEFNFPRFPCGHDFQSSSFFGLEANCTQNFLCWANLDEQERQIWRTCVCVGFVLE